MYPRHLTFTLSAIALMATASTATAQSKSAKSSKGPTQAGNPAHLHFVVAPTGNTASYHAREQLAGVSLPNDAIGTTSDVKGMLVVDPDGSVIKDSSKIVIGVGSLKSDKTHRDKFLREHSLDTDHYPTVTLVPTSFQGLTAKPGASPVTFTTVGDLTVHGVTHPTTWSVTAHADGNDIVGTAETKTTFKDLGIDQPRVPIVLSLEDTLKLEYDFRLTPKP